MIGQYGLADLGNDRYAYLDNEGNTMTKLRYAVLCRWVDGTDEWVDSRWASGSDAAKRIADIRAFNAWHGKDLRVEIEDAGTDPA